MYQEGVVTKRLATCPTCKRSGEFDYLGEQRWPPQVAQRLGLPSVINLWSCPHCATTVSEPDLLPYEVRTEHRVEHRAERTSEKSSVLSAYYAHMG
jgi:hypothetical protein